MTLTEARAGLRDLETSIGEAGKVHPRDALLAQVLLALLDGELMLPKETDDVQDRQLDRRPHAGRVPGVDAGGVPVPADLDGTTVQFDTRRDAQLVTDMIEGRRTVTRAENYQSVLDQERGLAGVPARAQHLTCVIGSHATDGGERIPGVGLVCPDHLEALQRWCGGPA
jgi:hypothetical protein